MEIQRSSSKGMEDISLSSYHGDNIRLLGDNQSAAWSHAYSGGVVFSQVVIRTGESFHVEITGNGHASIGFVQTDPKYITCIRDAVLKNKIRFLTNVRTLEKAGIVKIKKLESSVSLCYGGCCLEENADPYYPVWLVINLKFGSVQARIFSKDAYPIPFHKVTGENVEFNDRDSRVSKLKVENPASVCCLSRKLRPGEGVKLKFKPLEEKGRVPSRFHFTLGISNLNPCDLRQYDPESFSVCERVAHPRRWRNLKRFVDDVVGGKRINACTGYLQVTVSQKGEVKYAHSCDLHGQMVIPTGYAESGVLIVMELFRMSVEVVKVLDIDVYDYAEQIFTGLEHGFSRLSMVDKRTSSLRCLPRQKKDSGYFKFLPKSKVLLTKMSSSTF